MKSVYINNNKIEIILGDITEQDTEAIVNAANTSLLGGGGVDGAIHRAAGPGLLEECRKVGGCPTGEARITRAYDLKAHFVIHTVGPVYRSCRKEPALLESSYRKSLELADRNKIKSISFPSISTGVYGYPKKEAAEIAVRTVVDYLSNNAEHIYTVCFIQFSEYDHGIYENIFQDLQLKKIKEKYQGITEVSNGRISGRKYYLCTWPFRGPCIFFPAGKNMVR